MKPYHLVLIALPTIWGPLAFSDHPQAPTKSLPTATPPGARRTDDASAWLRDPPDNFNFYVSGQKIDERDGYEVVASAKDYLISPFGDLNDKACVKLSPDDARRYTGHHYLCPVGKTPYLVRAAYSGSAWGLFDFRHAGEKVFINHSSLGHSFQAYKTAFVLNLEFDPKEIYVSVSVAE